MTDSNKKVAQLPFTVSSNPFARMWKFLQLTLINRIMTSISRMHTLDWENRLLPCSKCQGQYIDPKQFITIPLTLTGIAILPPPIMKPPSPFPSPHPSPACGRGGVSRCALFHVKASGFAKISSKRRYPSVRSFRLLYKDWDARHQTAQACRR